MQNSEKAWLGMHPMVVFWLGVLTGAVVITLIFFYRFMSVVDFQSTLFKTQVMQRSATQQQQVKIPGRTGRASAPVIQGTTQGAAGGETFFGDGGGGN